MNRSVNLPLRHGLDFGAGATGSPGATFVNNPLTNMPDAPNYGQAVYMLPVSPRTKTYHHSFFNNLLIGDARNVPPGPFRDLRQGGGRFVIRQGLPILEGGSLPCVNWTLGLRSS